MVRRLLLAPLLALAFTGAAPTGVSASCVGPVSLPDQLQAAGLVFVGTAQATSDGDRVAWVRVESIWKGPDIVQYVSVHGSPVSGPSVSSVDRRYQSGTRYLFVLYSADQPLQNNSCSGTQPYTAELATGFIATRALRSRKR
jgi:hypothetical protein